MNLFYFLVMCLFLSTIMAFNKCVLENTNKPQLPRGTAMFGPKKIPQTGPYAVEEGNIPFVPGLTQGKPYTAGIVYPKNPKSGEKFPFLSFAHGTTASAPLSDYNTLLHMVASYGFIIVAVRSCPVIECASMFARDQVAAITACSQNKTYLHPSLKNADFETVGVFGHSMGGMSTLAAAGGGGTLNIDPAKYNIKAAVSQHPCQDKWDTGNGVKVPTMFTAGSVDKICADGCSARFFAEVPSNVPKILFDIKGADHFEPTNIGNNCEDEAVALFLSCHLRNENCDKVYGTSGKEICSQITIGHSLFNCTVSGHA